MRKNNAHNLSGLFITMVVLLVMSACDTTEQKNQIQVESYQLYDDVTIQVKLDPTFMHQSYSFSSLAEHDEYLDSLEQLGEVVLNPKLYSELSHYFDPIQLSVLDMDRSIHIGDTTFRATTEAIYKRTTNTNWILHLFYGKSGDISLNETAMIYENHSNLHLMKNYKFQDPVSAKLYSRFIKTKSSPKGTHSELLGKQSKHYYYNIGNSTNGEPYIIEYRNSYNGTIYKANIRWYVWNEQYRSWGAKAKGGTSTEILKLNDIPYGWVPMGDNSDVIGFFHRNNMVDNSEPWTKVQVKTSKSSKSKESDSWKVSVSKVNRKNNRGAWSYHSGKIRPNNSNKSAEIMNNYYVN